MTAADSLLLPDANLEFSAEVMLHHLHGAMDAGRAGRGVIEHLLETLPAKNIATFDSDQLLDFRSHRPWLSFSDWKFTEVEMPEIRLDLLSDDKDRNFLVLHGPEPDICWNGFVDTVLALAKTLGVKKMLGVTGLPGAVPHTRPTPVHLHGHRAAELPQQPVMHGEMMVPAGMDQLLEYSLGQAGIETFGIIAAVPYYLIEGDYPPAAAALLRAVVQQTGLELPTGDVEAASAQTLTQINQMVEAVPEAEQIVQTLEEHFDQAEPTALVEPKQEPLPTADELGARLEEFLARNDRLSRGVQLGRMDTDFQRKSPGDISSLRETPYERRDRGTPQVPPRSRGRHRAED